MLLYSANIAIENLSWTFNNFVSVFFSHCLYHSIRFPSLSSALISDSADTTSQVPAFSFFQCCTYPSQTPLPSFPSLYSILVCVSPSLGPRLWLPICILMKRGKGQRHPKLQQSSLNVQPAFTIWLSPSIPHWSSSQFPLDVPQTLQLVCSFRPIIAVHPPMVLFSCLSSGQWLSFIFFHI